MAPPDPWVTRIDGPWRHLDVHANGIRFHVVEATPAEQVASTPSTAQPLVIMLHGFGSFWWSWRHQLRGLTGARVVAVDLRPPSTESASFAPGNSFVSRWQRPK